MKKVIVLFLVLLLTLSFSTKVFADADQNNSGDINDGYWKIKTHQWVGQTFRPTGSKLFEIWLLLNGGGSSTQVTLSVYHISVMPQLVGTSTVNLNAGSSWTYFAFSEQDLTPNDTYVMYLSTASSDAYWYVKTSDTYDRGYAIVDSSAQMDQDFLFSVFTTDPFGDDSPSPTPTASTTSSSTPSADSTETASSLSTASATSTASSTNLTQDNNLKAPTQLKASNTMVNNAPAVKLEWTGSTTKTIDGYKVYRSEKENSDFTEVATVKKDELTYTDIQVKQDTKYYYYLIAYKDTKKSADSEKINITTNKITTALANTADQTNAVKNSEKRDTIIVLSIAALLIAGVVATYIIKNKKLKKAGVIKK